MTRRRIQGERRPEPEGVQRRLRDLVGLCLFLLTFCFAPLAAAAATEFLAGAAKVSVTPEAAVFPYAPSSTPSLNTGPGEKPFVGVHDAIFARALVLQLGARRVALVVLEATAVPEAGEVARAVADAVGVPSSQVMIAATHDHSTPLFSYAGAAPNAREQRELARLKDGAVEAARAALAQLHPARLAFGRGQAFININNGEQNGLRTGFDPEGPSDKSLDVLRLVTPEGSPIALLINYSSHAEVMFRSVTKAGGYEISGDLPGAVSRQLEASPAGAPVTLFTAGAEADQLTLFKSLQGNGPGALDAGPRGWALLDVQARRLTQAVLDVERTLPAPAIVERLDAEGGSAVCPGERLHIDPVSGAATSETLPPVEVPLAAVRIGDVVLAGVGGDLASQIGLAVKAASPAPQTTVVTMAGPSVGYIFADASYEHPGHGLTKSVLAPHCAEPRITAGLARLIGQTAPDLNLFTSGPQIDALIEKARTSIRPDQPVLVQPILSLGAYHANLEYRQGVAGAAVHKTEAEIFHVLQGSGALTTGGVLANANIVNDKNLSGTSIIGGVSRPVAAGDVLVVPAGTPHWFGKIEGRLVMIALKVPASEAPQP